MSKSWFIWIFGISFLFILLILFGVLPGNFLGNQPKPADNQSTEVKNDPKQLILGKWLLRSEYLNNWGDFTIEYFEDGTYLEISGSPSYVLHEKILGEYLVLRDGRLKKVYESCIPSPCKQYVHVDEISFPNPNTLSVATVPEPTVFDRITP